MNNKLQVILNEQGIEKSDVAKMVEAFGGPFEEAGVVLDTYKNIVVTDENDVATMSKAREARLLLKKARTTVENKRKELKADIVKQGKAIDSVARYVKEEIEPAEEYLELQEKFAEIKKAERAAKIKADRVEKLMQYTDDISVYNLDAMNDEQFESLLATLKTQHEAKIAEEKRIEEERIAKEKADEEARIAQAKENERLKAEALKREKEQAKKDAEAKAERDRIQKEADEKLAKERAEREKLEQAERDRIAEENRKKAEAEEAERQALLAPDKEKLIAFAQGLDLVRTTKLPAVKTNKAQELINYVEDELKRISNYLTDQAKEL